MSTLPGTSHPVSLKWTHYLLTAGAVASQTASGAVVYWNPADVTDSPGGPGFLFDMVSGAISTAGSPGPDTRFEITNYSTADYVQLIASASFNDDAVVGGDQMERLAAGTPIGPASTFGGLTYTYFDRRNEPGFPWNTGLDGTTGYLGLRFAISGNIHYGWARFTYDDATTGNITLHDFAYENLAGVPIAAGSQTGIPEPSSALLMILGAGGLVGRRRPRGI